jgi:hypothetical protein
MGLLPLGLLDALFLELRVVSMLGEGEEDDSNLVKDFVDPTLGREASGVDVLAMVAEAIVPGRRILKTRVRGWWSGYQGSIVVWTDGE